MFFRKNQKSTDDSFVDLSKEYPNLWNFLSGYFPADERNWDTDDEVVEGEVSATPYFLDVFAESKAMLTKATLPWRELTDATNYAFEDESDARQWLEHITSLMAQQLDLER